MPSDTPSNHDASTDLPTMRQVTDADLRPHLDSPAAYARALADAEPAAEQMRADGQAPEIDRLAERLAFERALRAAVARTVPSTAVAPQSLRDQILAHMTTADQAPAAESAPEPLPITSHPARHSPFARLLIHWGAIAAVLAICVGAIFMAGGQFFGSSSPTASAAVYTPAEFSNLTSFIARQHESCADFGEKYESKFKVRNVDTALDTAEQVLGSRPEQLAKGMRLLESRGLVFAGISRCGVPGEGPSVHVLYRRIDPPASISLFVQVDDNKHQLVPTHCYGCEGAQKAGKPIIFWRSGNFIYYIHSKQADVVAIVRNACHAPKQEQMLVSGAPAKRN